MNLEQLEVIGVCACAGYCGLWMFAICWYVVIVRDREPVPYYDDWVKVCERYKP